MNDEDVQLKNLYLEEESRREKDRMEEEARELREREIDDQWKKQLLD